jgi:hypothetical protein
MSNSTRTELQQEVVDALIESKAVNFDAIGNILAQFGARAAETGSDFGVVIGRRAWDICIPPEPYLAAFNNAARVERQA